MWPEERRGKNKRREKRQTEEQTTHLAECDEAQGPVLLAALGLQAQGAREVRLALRPGQNPTLQSSPHLSPCSGPGPCWLLVCLHGRGKLGLRGLELCLQGPRQWAKSNIRRRIRTHRYCKTVMLAFFFRVEHRRDMKDFSL